MANPIVSLGHRLLSNQFAYDSYQKLVGGVRYRSELVDQLASLNSPVFLDLGCGTATIASRVNPLTKYVGIDNSHKYLLKAEKDYPQHDFYSLDLGSDKWNIEIDSSNGVTASGLGVLHHLNDHQANNFLINCREILSTTSCLFTVDPVIVKSSSKIARWFANNDRGKFVRSPKRLEELFINNGFEVEINVKNNKFRIPLDTVEIFARPI